MTLNSRSRKEPAVTTSVRSFEKQYRSTKNEGETAKRVITVSDRTRKALPWQSNHVELASCKGTVCSSQQGTDSSEGADAPQELDLAVTVTSVSDESPPVGEKTTLSFTARNLGDRAPATLRYCRVFGCAYFDLRHEDGHR